MELLRDHQQAILSLLDDAEQILASVEPSRPKALALLRWQLLRLLRSYQLFKHVELFDPLARSIDPERAGLAAAMKVRCLELGKVFGDYVERWSTATDAGQTTYQDETGRMIERLRCQLGREAAEASLLLTDVAWTRRP